MGGDCDEGGHALWELRREIQGGGPAIAVSDECRPANSLAIEQGGQILDVRGERREIKRRPG